MKRVIGLTGSMGAGKSTVSAYLREKGIQVIDADEISREITRTGQPGYEAVVEAFGQDFVSEDGSLNRRALGQCVFADPARLACLEEILHPLIVARTQEELECAKETVVIDAPLLHKTGLHNLCDEVWVVSAPEKMRIERIIERDGITEEEARARLNNQMPPDEMEDRADTVLKNDGPIESLYGQIDEVLDG
jgi:dephospho-CoA kinase